MDIYDLMDEDGIEVPLKVLPKPKATRKKTGNKPSKAKSKVKPKIIGMQAVQRDLRLSKISTEANSDLIINNPGLENFLSLHTRKDMMVLQYGGHIGNDIPKFKGTIIHINDSNGPKLNFRFTSSQTRIYETNINSFNPKDTYPTFMVTKPIKYSIPEKQYMFLTPSVLEIKGTHGEPQIYTFNGPTQIFEAIYKAMIGGPSFHGNRSVRTNLLISAMFYDYVKYQPDKDDNYLHPFLSDVDTWNLDVVFSNHHTFDLTYLNNLTYMINATARFLSFRYGKDTNVSELGLLEAYGKIARVMDHKPIMEIVLATEYTIDYHIKELPDYSELYSPYNNMSGIYISKFSNYGDYIISRHSRLSYTIGSITRNTFNGTNRNFKSSSPHIESERNLSIVRTDIVFRPQDLEYNASLQQYIKIFLTKRHTIRKDMYIISLASKTATSYIIESKFSKLLELCKSFKDKDHMLVVIPQLTYGRESDEVITFNTHSNYMYPSCTEEFRTVWSNKREQFTVSPQVDRLPKVFPDSNDSQSLDDAKLEKFHTFGTSSIISNIIH